MSCPTIRWRLLPRSSEDARPRHPDASVVAIAKRLGVSEVATLKRRDFAYVRPRHTEAFTLLPERLASR